MSGPVILIAGGPVWADRAARLLASEGYEVLHCAEQGRYIPQLIHTPAALILVNGNAPQWEWWIVAAKTEQATRRVPLVVVAEESSSGGQFISAGADVFLAVGELDARLLDTVRDYQRVLSPAQIEKLNCQCEEALPPLAQEGFEKFNAGAYYAQHDAFEAQWREETGPVRDLYRAILQVGVAYYHVTRGNYTGALKMLRRSVQWFDLLPDVCQGVDVRQLREDASQVRAALEALEQGRSAQFDPALLKPLRLVDR